MKAAFEPDYLLLVVHSRNRQIMFLNHLIAAELSSSSYDEQFLGALFSLQFQEYVVLHQMLTCLVGNEHPLIERYDQLLFERRLNVLLFQSSIII
ncbi:hypothetical protein [Mucilaginibacter sp. FT3.2]|uniref:hypothetical protein n=1 Tax=Mucilaginibacter sp. FT3.2 TaxID=2723090 RepID=UPI00161E7950|nr:hypothetical protein [Mucilaginibacter sp. FT3.2]MBB6235348.1 hypothetical protein [Mucilaginibacter sp. FT3.2]